MPARRQWRDDEERKTYQALIVPMIALVTGAIVLLPSILGVTQPPRFWEPLFFSFWGLAIVSLLLLGTAWYICSISSARPPDRIHGIGNTSAILGVLALAAYVGLNAHSDRITPPTIETILVSPTWPESGSRVQLTAKVSDQDQDEITYSWTHRGTEFGNRVVTYWTLPTGPGPFSVQLEIQDDLGIAVAENLLVHVKPQH